MTDIVERLRESAARFHPKDFLHEAADEIERLRAALTKIAGIEDCYEGAAYARETAGAALTSHKSGDA